MTSLIEQCRNKTALDINKFSQFFYGKDYQLFQIVQNNIQNNNQLQFPIKLKGASRLQRLQAMLKIEKKFFELHPFNQFHGQTSYVLYTQQFPVAIHLTMFIPTLQNLCTQKQESLFLIPALKGQILGCYAQTQLAHGSDVKSLQTTATYDQKNQEFIIDSPNITAAKWWPGQLGLICTHALIFANLIINKKNYGIHTFIVQIRDQQHKPLPGIIVGDIGPKYGFNTKDNGYAMFKKVRIPRQNMLMKYAKVKKNGQYQKRGNQKIGYATMMKVRVSILNGSLLILAKVCTIATRFAFHRTQFKNKQGNQTPIIKYLLQKNKIIPHIAQAYAMRVCYLKSKELFETNINNIKERDDFQCLISVMHWSRDQRLCLL